MTAKEKVLKAHPDAYTTYNGQLGVTEVWSTPSGGVFLGQAQGRWGSEEAAWQNAAESLPTQPEQEIIEGVALSDTEKERSDSAHKYLEDAWIREMAEREDGCLVSAGGLVADMEPVAPVEAKEKRKDGLCWYGNGECKEPQTNTSFYCKHHEPKPTPSAPEGNCVIEHQPGEEKLCRICTPDSSSIPDEEPSCQCPTGSVDPKCPFYHPSAFDWEREIKDISIAIIHGRGVPDVSKNVVIRNLVWAIKNRTKPQTELGDSSSISTEHTFEEWWATDPVWSTPSSLARLAWNAAKGQSDGR